MQKAFDITPAPDPTYTALWRIDATLNKIDTALNKIDGGLDDINTSLKQSHYQQGFIAGAASVTCDE